MASLEISGLAAGLATVKTPKREPVGKPKASVTFALSASGLLEVSKAEVMLDVMETYDEYVNVPIKDDDQQPAQEAAKEGKGDAGAAAGKEPADAAEPAADADAAGKEAGADGADGAGAADAGAGADAALPLEATRILTAEDFARIRALRRRQLVEGALARHGLAPADKDKAAGGDKNNSKRGGPLQASRAKRRRLLEAAHAEADEALALEEARRRAGERRVDPASLEGRVKRRKDKAERLESVLAGREGREFGSRASLKKLKTGGLSERQKQKNKALPSAARTAQLRRRADEGRRRKSAKNFKGHVRGN
jgi:protein SDA1